MRNNTLDLGKELPILIEGRGEDIRKEITDAVDFLHHTSSSKALTESYLTLAFRQLGQRITSTTLPEDDTRYVEQEKPDNLWHSDLFDAANKGLYEQLSIIRAHLQKAYDKRRAENPELPAVNFKDPAEDTHEAYAQREALLKTLEGRKIISAVMALNEGYVINNTKIVHRYDRYQGDEGHDVLMMEMWLGLDGQKPDTEDSYVGGLLTSFLKWDPAKARLTTFLNPPIDWQTKKLYSHLQVKNRDYTQEADPDEDFSESAFSHTIAREDHRSWIDRARQNEFGGEFEDYKIRASLMGTIEKALRSVGKKYPREEQILRAYFEGVAEDNIPDSAILIDKFKFGSTLVTNEPISDETVSREEFRPISRERFRQIKVSAIKHFKEAWLQVAPDKLMPSMEFMIRKSEKKEAVGVADL